MKTLLRSSLLALLVFAGYAGLTSAATTANHHVTAGPTGFPPPQVPTAR
jgi:hypothetical protein